MALTLRGVDRSLLLANASLLSQLQDELRRGIAAELGTEVADVLLMPTTGPVVMALTFELGSSSDASKLQGKLRKARSLGPKLTEHLARLEVPGPVSVSDILAPTVPVPVHMRVAVPAAAVVLMLVAVASLSFCRERTEPGAEDMLNVPRKAGPDRPQVVPIIGLFRLATASVRLQTAVAIVFTMAFGMAMPLQLLLLRDVMHALFAANDDGSTPPVVGGHKQRDALVHQVWLKYVALAAVLFLTKAVGFLNMDFAAQKQALCLRKRLLLQALRKGPAWLAQRNAAVVAEELAADVQAFQNGLGEHFNNLVRVASMALGCFAISFLNEPRTSFVLVMGVPVTGYCISAAHHARLQSLQVERNAYAKAGSVASTALTNARLVTAFNGQAREVHSYQSCAAVAEAQSIRAGLSAGFAWGTAKIANYCSVAVGFYTAAFFAIRGYHSGCWRGGPENCISGGMVLASIFLIMRCSAMTLASLPESLSEVASAQLAAGRAFALLDEGETLKDERLCVAPGLVPPAPKGALAFEAVTFAYPGTEVKVLSGLSLNVAAGSTVAFVGQSGSGKSTALTLLLRFYDPQAGVMRLDGHDLRGLNLRWLRSQIALVDQEPVLFGCSILENILYGNAKASAEAAKFAAQNAGVHTFIARLPDGYDTLVGERGAQLSGGQKQRVAIARALVREPLLLLLDEATSAVDVEGEHALQCALDRLLKARSWTTIVVAHRLSTIRGADPIFVFQSGRVAESGTHTELLAAKGDYYRLVAQQLSTPGPELEPQEPEAVEQSPETTPLPPSCEVAPTNMPEKQVGKLECALENLTLTSSTMHSSETLGSSKPPESSTSHPDKVSLWRLLRLHRQDIRLLLPALLATALSGAATPIFGRLLAEAANGLQRAPATFNPRLDDWLPSYNARELARMVDSSCALIEGLAALMFVAAVFGHWALNKAGEQLVRRLRVSGFRAMLQQGPAWLDTRSPAALAEQLARDLPLVKDVTCQRLASLVQSAAMVVVGLLVMLWASWLLTLCLASLMPMMLGLSTLISPYTKRRKRSEEQFTTAAASLALEGLGNIRTVSAFGLESKLAERYVALAARQHQEMWSPLVIFGMGGPAGVACLIGAAVLLSNRLVQAQFMLPEDAMRVLMPLMWCTMGLFRGADFSTEQERTVDTVGDLLRTIEQGHDTDAEVGEQPTSVKGDLSFRAVSFSYPTRPTVSVLSGFDLHATARSTVALVGESGSGKSTVISLVLRFYDPQAGSVALDGRDLQSLSPRWLRDHMGLVQQEPMLFSGSIRENIKYGRQQATEAEVTSAAQLAGAHDFIDALQHRYNTDVGERGAMLSGGQKQRIALARALVRQPRILLLDEPTSALDTDSENAVQNSLGVVLKRQTTIVVAHRLSTIQGADLICVVKAGKVVESGSHQELMCMPDGHYRRLVNCQSKSSN